MKHFGGPVLFLDRPNINTDEIIPAKYLTEGDKESLRPHILEDLALPGFTPPGSCAGKTVIVSRENFGCGSSREHAPWVLELNGINMVIAPSFARIFRQNMYNCGMIACELPSGDIDALFKDFADRDTVLSVDPEAETLTFNGAAAGAADGAAGSGEGAAKKKICSFRLGAFEKALVSAGGWIPYAEQHY
ncbi:MAG: 3-isopropylmalate dehydratase small subunit [Spirochaetaceae bacterium]|jgi:3-isopropylmalate/(R)-2-methylmalate dehydratase small subunit|nr:3-isopropylmalate dehydratase small subunit [Spirochaetaceae bacterium]